MELFQNKKTWQKIVIILLLLLLFQFVIGRPVEAKAGTLLEPVTSLFANLGDGIMEILQKTFLNVDSSGAWVEADSNLWAKILTIAIGVALATVAIASVIISGGASLTIIASLVGAVIKIAAGTAIAYFAVSVTNFGSSGFYLPEYELTLESIFKDEALAFDINFFSPKDNVQNSHEVTVWRSVDLSSYGGTIITGDGRDANGTCLDLSGDKGYNVKFSKFEEINNDYKVDKSKVGGASSDGFGSNYTEYNWIYNNENYKMVYRNTNPAVQDPNNIYEVYLWKSTTETVDDGESYSPANILQSTISSWYKTLRNLALVALLSILVYIGIRITLSSVASDKAKYKQMLTDWVIALCLVFLMHYIMAFAVTINKKILNVISSITVNSYGNENDIVGDDDKKVGGVETNNVSTQKTNNATSKDAGKPAEDPVDHVDAAGAQLFIITGDAADRAYKTLVDDGKSSSDNKGADSPFYNRFQNPESEGNRILYWPTNDFMAQARILGQDIGDNETQTAVVRAGYNIIYVVLVIYTVIFCFTYLKRVIYMAFLTLMAPLVAVTYPIDKISDGKAQAFDMWFKEYIFNLLMQPMHLILYMILVGSAMKFAATNIFYAVVAIGFLVPAEKILRRFFGFEKAQTPGMFAGPAGSALMMSGLNKLMHKRPKGGPGGKNSDDSDDEENSKVTTYKNGKDPMDTLAGSEGSNSSTRTQSTNTNNENDQNNEDNETNNNNSQNNPMINFRNIGLGAGNGSEAGSGAGATNGAGTGNNPNSTPDTNKDKEKDKPKEKRRVRLGRSIHRGAANYKAGMVKRYKRNKKLKGGWIQRGARVAAGAATAATMATAAGMIGIASGDPSKAAQYMAAGAAGGFALGKAGVDKTVDKYKEQYKEPLKEAKIGYYGKKEYERREHEKFKRREFEQNGVNIAKVQDTFGVSWKEAQEISKQMAEHTETDGINSFKDALAVEKMIRKDGYSKAEARMSANYDDTVLGRQNIDNIKREDRLQYQADFVDRLVQRGRSRSEAIAMWNRVYNGAGKYTKYTK